MNNSHWPGLTLAFLGWLTFGLSNAAAAQDVDAMAKWTALTIVHYRVVGEFSGETTVLISTGKLRRLAPVTDRVEIEFDWDQQEMKLASEPVIRNFPTQSGDIVPVTGCPPARVKGALEFATVLDLSDESDMRYSGVLELIIKRDYPAGSIPSVSEDLCGAVWEDAPAKSETITQPFTVALAMALTMPGMIPTTSDGNSLVMESEGWTWTQTPTPVK